MYTTNKRNLKNIKKIIILFIYLFIYFYSSINRRLVVGYPRLSTIQKIHRPAALNIIIIIRDWCGALVGFFQADVGGAVCDVCPPGAYCDPHELANATGVIVPVDCLPGFYCPLRTQFAFQNPCAPGTYSNATQLTAQGTLATHRDWRAGGRADGRVVGRSDSQSVSPSTHQPASVSQSVNQPVRQSVILSVRQSVSPSVSPSARQPVSPSVSPSVHQSVKPSVRQSVSLFVIVRNSNIRRLLSYGFRKSPICYANMGVAET